MSPRGTPALSAHRSSARGAAAATPARRPATKKKRPRVDEAAGKAIVAAINQARKARNKQSYVNLPRLRHAAEAHVQDLARHGLFSHDSSNGETCANRIRRFFPSAGWSSWSVGECLFWIGAGSTTAHDVLEAWLDSPPHRAIVLSPSFRRVGVGVVHLRSGTGTFAGGPATIVNADFGFRTR